MDQYNRWASLVHTPGEVRLVSHHAIEVPNVDATPPNQAPRPGIRLLVQPITGTPDVWTIDVTSSKVIAMLEGFLANPGAGSFHLGWRTRGLGVYRKDTLYLRPVGPAEVAR